MLAVYAASTSPDDPLSALAVGERPAPSPPPGWALLDVDAASLNHHDLFTLRGISAQPVRPPQTLGCDVAGRVAAYAAEPPDWAPPVGSRVVAHSVIGCGRCAACARGELLLCRRAGLLSEGPYPGTLAEVAAAPVENLIALPDAVGSVEAACLPTTYLTAYRMLFSRARLRPGMSLLVQGAAGGVASAAIQLGSLAGLRVIATTRDAEKGAFARSLGAMAVVALDADAAREVRSLAGGDGVDAVVETVGEPTWDLSLRAVRPGGAVVVAGATAGPNPPAQLNRVFWRQLDILGSTMGERAELVRLVDLCASGALRPAVDTVLPLSGAREAFDLLASGRRHGKLVLTPA